jgi:hypothetical protein
MKELSGLSNPVYIAVDGPTGQEDLEAAAEIFRVIGESDLNIVEVKKNETNIGTYNVAKAIDWVLESNEALIIIEEDVLVSKDFIYFAEAMLKKYEFDFRIGSISAMNSVPRRSVSHPDLPYRFSCYFYAWGWATWKSRWDGMIPICDWKIDQLTFPRTAKSLLIKNKWKARFRDVEQGKAPGLWDYHWIYTCWTKRWLTVIPNVNLSINIGFDSLATHTKIQPDWAPSNLGLLNKIQLQLESPVRQDLSADLWSARVVHNSSTSIILKTKLKNKLKIWGLLR